MFSTQPTLAPWMAQVDQGDGLPETQAQYIARVYGQAPTSGVNWQQGEMDLIAIGLDQYGKFVQPWKDGNEYGTLLDPSAVYKDPIYGQYTQQENIRRTGTPWNWFESNVLSNPAVYAAAMGGMALAPAMAGSTAVGTSGTNAANMTAMEELMASGLTQEAAVAALGETAVGSLSAGAAGMTAAEELAASGMPPGAASSLMGEAAVPSLVSATNPGLLGNGEGPLGMGLKTLFNGGSTWLAPLLGAAGGALLSDTPGAPTSTSTTTGTNTGTTSNTGTTRVSYSPTEQAMRDQLLGRAKTAYEQSQANADPAGDRAFNDMMNAGIREGLNARDVNNNPYLRGAIESATRGVTQKYNDPTGVLSNIRSDAVSNGQYGGTRQGLGEGVAGGRYIQEIGDINSRMMSAAYDKGQDTFTRTLAMAPGVRQSQQDYAYNQTWRPAQAYSQMLGSLGTPTTTTTNNGTTNQNSAQTRTSVGEAPQSNVVGDALAGAIFANNLVNYRG